MCCVVLDASHIFMYCSFRDAPVDAFADIFRRDVVSQVSILVHLLTTSVSLFMVTASVPTTIVTMGVLPQIIVRRTAMVVSPCS